MKGPPGSRLAERLPGRVLPRHPPLGLFPRVFPGCRQAALEVLKGSLPFSTVKRTESPSNSKATRSPLLKPNRSLTPFGMVTCPLLVNVAFIELTSLLTVTILPC